VASAPVENKGSEYLEANQAMGIVVTIVTSTNLEYL
jgi:hypothetical protein